MSINYKYRIYCITEEAYQYEIGVTSPTVCPNDSGHTINANSINIAIEPIIVHLPITNIIKEKDLKTDVPWVVTTYNFPGTTIYGHLKIINFITSMKEGKNGKEGDAGFGFFVNIYDLTNNISILDSLEVTAEKTIELLNCIVSGSNCSEDGALWQIGIKKASSTGDINLKSIDLFFY